MVDDLKNDPDFEFLDEINNVELISEAMELPIGLATRFPISSYQGTLLINACFKVANREDLMISRSGFDNVKKRLLQKAVEKREKEDKGRKIWYKRT